MTIAFWTNEPTILLNKEYLLDLWPTSDMCYEQKLNAITRLILIITILGYIFTFSNKILFTGFISILLIFILFKVRKEKITRSMMKKEGFTVNGNLNNYNNTTTNPVTLETVLKSNFKEGTKKNPFSNVLLTEIMDQPERKSAPPAFNPDVEEDITKNIKKTIQYMNPGIKNTNKQLFGDLSENFNLDQSNRAFFSTANTRVSNDQGAFAKYLYGGMISAKESTPEGDFARVQDNIRYNLY
jgi:hypothetical protein